MQALLIGGRVLHQGFDLAREASILARHGSKVMTAVSNWRRVTSERSSRSAASTGRSVYSGVTHSTAPQYMHTQKAPGAGCPSPIWGAVASMLVAASILFSHRGQVSVLRLV